MRCVGLGSIVIGLLFSGLAAAAAPSFQMTVAYPGEYVRAWPGQWQPTAAVRLGVAYEASPRTQISLAAWYARQPFRSATYPYAVPCDASFRYDMRGEASRTYGVDATFRVFGFPRSTGPFALLRAGVVAVDVGPITATTWWDDSPEQRYERVVAGTGTLLTDAYLGIGLGVSLPAGGDARVLLESALMVGSEQGQLWLPVAVVLQF
jgi:hypothetical protein